MLKINYETVVFGGGCFWCTEAVFSNLKGVEKVTPGYAGGIVKNPTYEQVCTGKTNHSEVVEIIYDPKIISFSVLLEIFFAFHDPSTLNQQGADIGSQYRSIILYTLETQKKESEKYIQKLLTNKIYQKVTTELKLLEDFYPAEVSHQRYFTLHQSAPYCQMVIDPKIKKLQEKYKNFLK